MTSSSPIAATGRTEEIMSEVDHAGTGGPPPVHVFYLDSPLRLLLLVSSLAALLVLVTGEQTEVVPVYTDSGWPYFPSRSVDFGDLPALKYLLAALVITCAYSAFTLLTSAHVVRRSSPSTKLLFQLVLFDALMAGLLAAATGAGGAVAHIGLKGNPHSGWNKICHIYDIFCRHVAGAVATSLFASIVLVALAVLSAYSLYRRSL